MEAAQTLGSKQGFPKWLLPVFGYALSAASLYWVLSRFPWSELGDHLRTMDWTWVAVAIVVEMLAYVVDTWRWIVLLRPVGHVPFRIGLQSVFVGLFCNAVLPARAGEVVRCFLLSYETDVHLSLALTSNFICRIMDGLWLVIIYAVITTQVSSHIVVSRVMWAFGTGTVVIALLLLWVLFHRQKAHYFVNNASWAARFIHLLDELHSLGHWRELGMAMAIGGLYWAAQVLALWAIARADAFDFTLSDMSFLLIVKTVGTLIPNAPANVGAYQATTVYALERLLTEAPEAKILAELMFTLLTFPQVAIGAVAVAMTGVKLGDLHKHAQEAHGKRREKELPKEVPEVPKG